MISKTLILASVVAVALTACDKKEDTASPAGSEPSTTMPAPSSPAPTTPAPGSSTTPAPGGGSTTPGS
ncbi:endopeptidase [Bordetella petrii]|uniref:endopeptidase n=1 Tax=Bordetella petrii TaxID=94624 RepID=UPI001A96CE1F|nr:endopeptidase [Bordetella petrii]MBO1114328.1 endopeptidase [Bordetella petrii]